jgi:hypothetical protein
MPDRLEIARKLITDSLYMSPGTADAAGTPWVSPVYYTPDGFTDFYWVSSPETQHSPNLANRPEAAIAIFDSHAIVGTAEAVYLKVTAGQVPDADLEPAIAIYNSRISAGRDFGLEEVVAPALFRLYRATAHEQSLLIRGGDPELGTGADSRLVVDLT